MTTETPAAPTGTVTEEPPLQTSTRVSLRKPDANSKSTLVVVANRLPTKRVKREGKDEWQLSPGGLVSALQPVLERSKGTWVGWSGDKGPAPEPFRFGGIRLRPVPLLKDEYETFYEGFANRTIWPLYHDALRPPQYRRRWWYPHRDVNMRFAQAAAEEVAPGGTVWVHDYHLQLVPAMLRSLRPDIRIGFFLHIPFPPAELFAQLPWRRQILEGILGSDLIGTQTPLGAENVRRLAERYLGARREGDDVYCEGRRVRVGAHPISIDVQKFDRLASDEQVIQGAQRIREKLGSRRRIILGVDRLDYTKGIDQRFRAYQELLRSGRIDPSETVFVQIAVPSRERVSEYRELRRRVEEQVGQINGEFGDVSGVAVHYMRKSLSPERLVSFYLAADVMLVTPLRDGMNLVCKEYISTRHDSTGVLVLSEFTGAARQLSDAILVNPYDIDALEDSIHAALTMSPEEGRSRMERLRSAVRGHTVFDWATSFMEELGE